MSAVIRWYDDPSAWRLILSQRGLEPAMYEAAREMQEAERQAGISERATPTGEPLWAESEQVPFVSRSAGVPLSAATFAAGGTEVTRTEPVASGAGIIVLALLALWLLG